MPKEMSEAELAHARDGAREIDTFEFRNEDDEDHYIEATLYQAKDGRKFRVVDASGMNSVLNGAAGGGEWITEAEAANWNEF